MQDVPLTSDPNAPPCDFSVDRPTHSQRIAGLLDHGTKLAPLLIAALFIQDYVREYLDSVSKPWHGAAGFYELGVTSTNTAYIVGFLLTSAVCIAVLQVFRLLLLKLN